MLAVSAALSLMLAASPVEAWTLERVVGEALARSPEVSAARARESGAEGVRAADGRWLTGNPELELEGATDALTEGAGEQRLSVEVSQTLQVAGQRGLRVRRAESEVDAARGWRRAVELEVAGAAVDAAVELERRGARARLAEEALGLARALETAAARRFAAGDVSELERNGAALERARAEARAALARAEAEGARAALNRRLGRAVGAPLMVALEGATADVPPGLEGERPELRAARAESEAARAEVELLRRERIPDPTVSLGYERERRVESHGALADLHVEHLLVARLSVPLPVFDRNQRELAEARARRVEREAEREGREREVEAERAAARSTFEAARAAHAALVAASPAAERNLELVRRAYEAGELGLDALLLARDRAFAARGETVEAAAELARARTALLRAAGRLPTGEVPR